MRRAAPAAAAAVAFLLGGCASGRPSSPEASARAAAALERVRTEAYRPRRWKALFRGEVAPRVGAIGRGFLAIFWDGLTLTWKTSAPLAGDVQSGTLSLGSASGAPLPIPGRLAPREAIGVLLGVPDGGVAGPARDDGDRVILPLEGGTLAVLDRAGRVVEVRFRGGVRVVYEPGSGLPRKLTATSREGRAVLELESLGPWPEGEAP